MNDVQTQRGLELEIMELEDELAYKKDILKKLRKIGTNGRYYLGCDGFIHELLPTINDLTWQKAISQNNTFKTKKDAEKERDRRELLYEFNQFKNERNNGWTPDWKDCEEPKFYIAFNFNGDKGLTTSYMHTLQTFVTFGYFNDFRACMDAIAKFGDRIKKLYID